MSELVQKLSQGSHPLEVSVRPQPTVKALKESLDRGYVLVKFTGTRGGTELGIPVDRERTDLTNADFERETGRLTLVGSLSLDWVNVRCVADIDLASLQGQGHLEPLAD